MSTGKPVRPRDSSVISCEQSTRSCSHQLQVGQVAGQMSAVRLHSPCCVLWKCYGIIPQHTQPACTPAGPQGRRREWQCLSLFAVASSLAGDSRDLRLTQQSWLQRGNAAIRRTESIQAPAALPLTGGEGHSGFGGTI